MTTQELEARVKDIANTRLQAVLQQVDTINEQLRTMRQLIYAFYDIINDKMPEVINIEDTVPFYEDSNCVKYYLLIRNGCLAVKDDTEAYAYNFEQKHYTAILTRLPSFILHVQAVLDTMIKQNKTALEQYNL